jgi:hypothetical protein
VISLAERIEEIVKVLSVGGTVNRGDYESVIEDADRAERELGFLRNERRAVHADRERLIRILSKIHQGFLPPDTVIDGVTWRFSPPPELALETLRAIGDAIKAIPDSLATTAGATNENPHA